MVKKSLRASVSALFSVTALALGLVTFNVVAAPVAEANPQVRCVLGQEPNLALKSHNHTNKVGAHTIARIPELTGGPDAFGYSYIDSNSPGGPVFNWIDISESGTQVFGPDTDDEYAYPVPVRFAFSFYGQTFTEAAIGSNGHIYFGTDAYLGLGNVCIPGSPEYTPQDNIIAVYWDDLYTDAGQILYQTIGIAPNRQFVVMFHDVSFCCDSAETPMEFEAILNEADGSILLQYLNPNTMSFEGEDNGGEATVGIQKDPSLGLEYSCNTPSLSANLAIRFSTVNYTDSFYDDTGRSQFCVNFKTGAFRWNILSGNGAGTSYTGVGLVLNGNQKVYSKPGAPDYLNFTYDIRKKRATGYLITAASVYSALNDKLTTNDPPGCSAAPPPSKVQR